MTLNDRHSRSSVKVGTFGVNWVTNNIDPRGGGEKVEVTVVAVAMVVVVVVIVVDSSRACTRRLLAPATILRFSVTRFPRDSYTITDAFLSSTRGFPRTRNIDRLLTSR